MSKSKRCTWGWNEAKHEVVLQQTKHSRWDENSAILVARGDVKIRNK